MKKTIESNLWFLTPEDSGKIKNFLIGIFLNAESFFMLSHVSGDFDQMEILVVFKETDEKGIKKSEWIKLNIHFDGGVAKSQAKRKYEVIR